jgi:bifunctional non-homologous end joining protein LigD
MEGVLRSWAVPKGPSLDPGEKRLAIQTEDHPVDYGGFEGVIPKGNYGAGKVIIWDRGTYEMVDPATPEEGWRRRKLHFVLKGRKLGGEWILVETRRGERQWLFFKVDDAFASVDDITLQRPDSVVSGLGVDEIDENSGGTRHWHIDIERELEERGVKKGRRSPIPTELTPMLATLVDGSFDDDEWLFEIKLDGIRALAYKDLGRVDLRSRNQKPFGKRFPGVLRALELLPADSAVLDGEIVALDPDGRSRFSRIQPRIHLTRAADIEEAESAIPVHFSVFDLIYLNGYDLTRVRLEDRKSILRKLVEGGSALRYVDHVVGRGLEFFEAASGHRLEGIVAKRRDSLYHQRRSGEWLKIKRSRIEDFVVAGFTPPESSRKHLGALVLGLYDAGGKLAYVGRAGSGFDDSELKRAHAMLSSRIVNQGPFDPVPAELSGTTWVRPDLVCEVRFAEWTREGRLRAPVFVAFRDDKEPTECVLHEDPIPDAPEAVSDPPADATSPEASVETRVELTNMTKVFWPGDGWTKGDLIHYYREIADILNPYLLDRLLVQKRYPDGITGEYFYQKDAPDYTPEWLRTDVQWSEDAQRQIRYFVGGESETLVYLANMGGITQNPWHSRLGRLEHPDYAIFDLDPGPGVAFSLVRRVALELRKVLDELELRAYPKTSGASGIHVYLPLLEGAFTYRDVRTFTEAIAGVVVARLPELATIERVVRRRPKGVYVDFLQNVKGKTIASVYSPRARAGAPVSTPLNWDDLKRSFEPVRFHMKNIFRRLKRVGDLFQPVLTDRQDIGPFLRALK